MVKKLITVSLIVLTASVSVYAQRSIAPLSAGPFVAFKGGTNVGSTADVVSNTFVFNGIPDVGASLYVPFGSSSNLGLQLDVGYITLAYGQEIDSDVTNALLGGLSNLFDSLFDGLFDGFGTDIPGLDLTEAISEDDLTFTNKFHYLGIAPQLSVSSLLIGFQIGIPLGGTSENASGTSERDIETDEMKTIFEINAGANIPLVKNKNGRLNLLLKGSYALSGLAEQPDNIDDDAFFDPKVLSVAVGINYLFSLSSGRSSAEGG